MTVREATPFGRADYSGDLLECCFMQLVVMLEPGICARDVQECLPEIETFDEIAFVNAMANLGYYSTTLRVAAFDIDPRLLPCLYIPRSGSPRIIASSRVEAGHRYLSVYDADTKQVIELEATPELLSERGSAYFFRKQNASDVDAARQIAADTGYSWFRQMLSRFAPVFWQLACLGVLINLLALAAPVFVMVVYDRVIATRETEPMTMLIVGVALAVIAETALRLMRTRLLSWLTARVHFLVGSETFKRLMELPPSVSQRASVTAQLSRIKSFESVRDFFSGPVFISTIELPVILIASVILLIWAPVMVLVPLISAAVFMGIFAVLRHHVAVAIKVSATHSAVAQRFSVETFQDREDIRSSGLAAIWKGKFRELSGRENAAQMRLVFLSAIGEHLAYVVNILTGIVGLYIGVQLVWAETLTTGALVAVMILIWRAISPFYSLCAQVARFEQCRHSVKQINALMGMQTEDEVRRAHARLPQIQGAIDFQNVGIRYSRDSGIIFFGLNAHIKAGEVIGVTGTAGSGKTSLLKLVQSVVQPHIGKVLIDGVNSQQLSAYDLRRQIATIPQLPHIFPGTVAENLRIVKPSASDEELWMVLEAVGSAQIVRSMPRGLQQSLKAKGRTIELIYRLAFARVILQDPSIVLVDELPGNLLNTGLGELLEQLIVQSNDKRTILFVSQRMDHLRQANRIIHMQHGATPLVTTLDALLEMSK